MIKYSEFLLENGFKKFIMSVVSVIIEAFKSLKFGQSRKISISDYNTISEAKSQDKGVNGLIAEYICARSLAEKLSKAGLSVVSDINHLASLESQAIKRLGSNISAGELSRAINQGEAIATSMYESIIKDGQDLIFVDYNFVSTNHSFDIVPTGASTTKGSSSDMSVIIRKKGRNEVLHEVLVSLKAYAGKTTSQGSNSSANALFQMFANVNNKRITKSEFINIFGSKGNEFYEALELFKMTGDEYLNSSEGAELRQYYINKGIKNPKTAGNVARKQAIGDYFVKKHGYKQEHKLAELFVKLFDSNKNKLKLQGDYNNFSEAFKKIIGFDDVTTYNAIADKNGVIQEVVNSNVSGEYRKMYEAIKNKADVNLIHKEGTGSITVEVSWDNTVLRSLSLNMWKDGTIQFKFTS